MEIDNIVRATRDSFSSCSLLLSQLISSSSSFPVSRRRLFLLLRVLCVLVEENKIKFIRLQGRYSIGSIFDVALVDDVVLSRSLAARLSLKNLLFR